MTSSIWGYCDPSRPRYHSSLFGCIPPSPPNPNPNPTPPHFWCWRNLWRAHYIGQQRHQSNISLCFEKSWFSLEMVSSLYLSLRAKRHCLRKLGNIKRRKYICKVGSADKATADNIQQSPHSAKYFWVRAHRKHFWVRAHIISEQKNAHRSGNCKELGKFYNSDNWEPKFVTMRSDSGQNSQILQCFCVVVIFSNEDGLDRAKLGWGK